MLHAIKTPTAPGHLTEATIGGVRVTIQLAVGGGATVTIWPTASAYDAIRYSYLDQALADRRFNVIAQLAATGMRAAEIAGMFGSDAEYAIAQVRAILDEALEYATADDSAASAGAVRALQAAKEDVETEEDKAAIQALADDMNAFLDGDYSPRDPHLALLAGKAVDDRRARDAKERQQATAPVEQDEPTDAELIAFAKTVGDTVAAGVRDSDRPTTLAELAQAMKSTHPQVGPIRRRRTRNGVAR